MIVDASVVVAGLLDDGPEGRWAEDVLASVGLAAPHLLPAEVANVLRRMERRGDISSDLATLAMGDIESLGIDLVEFAPFHRRIWALHHNLTSYDGWYVALAEAVGEPLATLDRRLADATGIGCEVLFPSPS